MWLQCTPILTPIIMELLSIPGHAYYSRIYSGIISSCLYRAHHTAILTRGGVDLVVLVQLLPPVRTEFAAEKEHNDESNHHDHHKRYDPGNDIDVDGIRRRLLLAVAVCAQSWRGKGGGCRRCVEGCSRGWSDRDRACFKLQGSADARLVGGIAGGSDLCRGDAHEKVNRWLLVPCTDQWD